MLSRQQPNKHLAVELAWQGLSIMGNQVTPWAYGLDNFGDLFTHRQIATLSTLADLVSETKNIVTEHAAANVDCPSVYADTIATYLAIFVSRMANLNNAMCQWRSDPAKEHVGHMFARQAIPMVWDFAEANPFGGSAGDFEKTFAFVPKVLPYLPANGVAVAMQADAQTQTQSRMRIVSTDPPYYDNVPYADLSDFFYVWLRRVMRSIEPELFATMAVPKGEELVADALRHQGKASAEGFFLKGMTEAMRRLAADAHPAAPLTIYYAFKQSETKASAGTSSTGWETFLEAMLSSGLSISGTWPVRTELGNRVRGSESNALASSIVLVCRPRPADAPSISRRAFLRELNQVLPEALDEMTRGAGDERLPVAPVDLSQAIIGPGMAVFSKYAAVLEADGTPMSVRTALQLINRFLAEDDFDHDSQFCLHWFQQYGWKEGKFGEADTLARAKGTSVKGVEDAGVLYATGGIVRLLKWPEYPDDWDPQTDNRLPVWELLHHLIRIFKSEGERAVSPSQILPRHRMDRVLPQLPAPRVIIQRLRPRVSRGVTDRLQRLPFGERQLDECLPQSLRGDVLCRRHPLRRLQYDPEHRLRRQRPLLSLRRRSPAPSVVMGRDFNRCRLDTVENITD
jgi:putative DNA methylase